MVLRERSKHKIKHCKKLHLLRYFSGSVIYWLNCADCPSIRVGRRLCIGPSLPGSPDILCPVCAENKGLYRVKSLCCIFGKNGV